MVFEVYTDGGSRGNPGVSGFGLVIYDDNGHVVYQQSQFLGIKTNNEAEYSGLIAALTWILENKQNFPLTKIVFYSDSQLMVRQVLGVYKVKASHLQLLHQTTLGLLSQIGLPYEFYDVRREKNQLADKLANEAMDRKA